MFCGAFILAAGYVASYLVAHVPLACLATLVIAAELELANLPVIRLILQSGAQDRTVFLATFVTALVAPLDVAIFFGTGVAVPRTSVSSFEMPADSMIFRYRPCGITVMPFV